MAQQSLPDDRESSDYEVGYWIGNLDYARERRSQRLTATDFSRVAHV